MQIQTLTTAAPQALAPNASGTSNATPQPRPLNDVRGALPRLLEQSTRCFPNLMTLAAGSFLVLQSGCVPTDEEIAAYPPHDPDGNKVVKQETPGRPWLWSVSQKDPACRPGYFREVGYLIVTSQKPDGSLLRWHYTRCHNPNTGQWQMADPQ